MGIQDGNFESCGLVFAIISLLIGLAGCKYNGIILTYYAKKLKLDQLSIIYGSISVLGGVMSLLMVINFIFFFLADMYYTYAEPQTCQSNLGIFFAASYKVLFMVAYRSIVFLLTALIFLTACKVKWSIFKIKTQLLKHLVTFFPVCLFAVIGINCFIEVNCATPFYVPWLSNSSSMTIIYFWILLVVPGIIALGCMVFLIYVIVFQSSSLLPENQVPQSKLATIQEGNEPSASGNIVSQKLSNVKSKLTNSKSNLAAKFDGREVTKRTIFTILILTTGLIVTIAASCILPLNNIYSDNDILGYDIHHTTSDFNNIFIFSELVPCFILAILNPLVLMYRINGLRKFCSKLFYQMFGCCIKMASKKTEVDV